MPERIQLRRTKGWRKPEGAVVVSRPSKWGNPFLIGSNRTTLFVHDTSRVWWTTSRSHEALREAREQAAELFRRALIEGRLPFEVAEVRRELRGCDVCCWCGLDEPCHGDPLLELANGGRDVV